MQGRRGRHGGGYFVFCEAPLLLLLLLLLLLFAFFRARMTCNYVWACPKSEVTQITPSFSRGVEMRERKEPTPPPHPVHPHPPSPRRHHIKYHEIISVISMEICLQIINTLPPPIPFLSFIYAESLSLSELFFHLFILYNHIRKEERHRNTKKEIQREMKRKVFNETIRVRQ